MSQIQTISPIIYTNFNEDASCCCCGTETGFYIYNTRPFKERFHRELGGGIGIIEIYRRTNIVLLVGGGKNALYPPNKVIIWNDYDGKPIGQLEFPTNVKGLRCRNNKLLVILEKQCYLHNFYPNTDLITIYETYYNPVGIGDLTENILAIPSTKPGTLHIEYLNQSLSHEIMAHENPISHISLSFDGELCATCSARGTILRVWSTQSGSLLREFRRGLEPTKVISLSFNANNTMICLSSEKGTIHFYHLIPSKQADITQKNRKYSFSFMKNLLPDYFSSEWSSFSITLPENQLNSRPSTGIAQIDPFNEKILLLITPTGILHRIDI